MGNMHKKSGENRARISGDMIADRHTNRQTQTATTILRSPHGGGVIREWLSKKATSAFCYSLTVQVELLLSEPLHGFEDYSVAFTSERMHKALP